MKKIPIAGLIIKSKETEEHKTGSWRVSKPVTDFNKCTHCLICWINCPDSCIIVKNKKKTGTNYNYCKGCAICATVCPTNAIHMVEDKK